VKTNYLNLTNRATEAVGSADAGLAIDPNFARLCLARATAENNLGRFEKALSDVHQAMRLSPHDPEVGFWHGILGVTELGRHNYDAAIDEEQRAIDGGFRPSLVYSVLVAGYALEDKEDEAKTALAEARRLNPKLTVKWCQVADRARDERSDATRSSAQGGVAGRVRAPHARVIAQANDRSPIETVKPTGGRPPS